ncbi:NYN domain-containing protein [Trametes polyzona]|nr:NYN domain-containing protein [Trametes polyzona]
MRGVYDEHVAIFWDYENCTPACTVPGYDVVNNIRQVAHQYGSVKLFKAYLELSEQSSSKSIGLRSELQSCGVSLTDCPHNGRKDVADKMMIVDMLTYAIDNPAPATIVLISGDRDFVYAVSVLRLRKYRVVVVAPFAAHGSLKSQASVVLDWEADIMRRTTVRPPVPEAYYQAPADDVSHRSPRRPSLAFVGALPPVTQKFNRRPSFRAAATAAAAPGGGGDTSGGLLSHRRSQTSASMAVAEGASQYDHVLKAPDRSLSCSVSRQVILPSGVGTEDVDDYGMLDRQPIPDISDVMEDMQVRLSLGGGVAGKPEIPSVSPDVSPPQSSLSASSSITEDDDVNAPAMPSLPPASRSAKAMGFFAKLTGSPRPFSPAASGTSSMAAPPDLGTRDSRPNTQGSRWVPDGPNSPELFASPPVEPAITDTICPLTDQSASPEATLLAEPLVPSSSLTGSQRVMLDNPVKGPTSSPSPTVPVAVENPVAPPAVPEQFRHLVDILEELRRSGADAPLRTTVAVRLLQASREIYAQAGTASFKEYSLAAERAGIVTLGGYLGTACISLKPQYCSGNGSGS